MNNIQDALDVSGNVQKSSAEQSILGKDWLDLANVEAGNVEIKLEPVHCQDMLVELANTIHPLAEAKRLHVEVILPITTVIIQTDRRALSQILLNLMHNAVKFTDAGSVCLELRRRLERESGKIATEFSVEDTGKGIQPEELTRLFQARRHRNTGLFQSQKLASWLGGHISVMSIPNKGSLFRLVILGK